MNQPRNGLSDSVAIDPQHPWLGLASYSEETRAYFHGRDEEAAELARRVRRKLLTVLFGQSGLGKTSLLRAGLVPRLRDEGYCPVYVRVDYSPESPSPSEQIKQAIFRASAAAGHWTRAGSAVEGESLWEFLHHRGDLLRDADGRTLLPLLIFDQFEEIFTLAQADDAGRMRARRFLEELADLVENRPPAALEQRLEQDEAHAEQFDFARADYRILVALREDYLAHLESVKGSMPSITQNRMRLARMTGAQALAAVLQPGGRLVSEDVAESIVRFVAGGSELANAEVEPSLLSLVCRELNTVRIAQGRDEISADLLAGSRATILTEFYERALADQPAGVRRVIEDELLTDSGYRESLAEERVRKALAAAGAAPDALAILVDRRLLRIEERLDMRRVELTHDVLCSVVASSRDLRHAREAREAAERQLAAQQAREAETHRTLLRTRMVAAVAAVLMLVAGASAVFGWVNYRRARVADAQAQQARADAEKLVGFLIEDFYAELEPTGRLETMGKLAHMAVSYYDGLPPGLLTPQTRIYRGMALIREGGALLARGDVEASNRSLGEARALFEKLRAEGEQGEAVTLGLALAIFTKFSAATVGAPGGEDSELRQAADLLRPLAHAPGSSRQTRLVYADVLNYLSHTFENKEEAIATCEESRKLLVGLGALDLSDLSAASVYADTSDSQARHVMSLGRLDEAEKLERDVYAIADQVLMQRPGDFRSLRNRALAANLLGRLAERRHDPAAAADYASKAEESGESYVRSNPSDLSAWDYWIRGKEQLAGSLLERGRVSDSIRKLREAVALGKDPRRPASLASQLNWIWFQLAGLEARAGQRAAALASLEEGARASLERQAQIPKDSPRRALPPLGKPGWGARMHHYFGEFQQAHDMATATAASVRKIRMPDDDVGARSVRDGYLRHTLTTAAAAALRLGRYEEAAAACREQLALPPDNFTESDAQEQVSRTRVMLAHALVQLDSAGEARTILEPDLARYRGQMQRGAGGLAFRRDFAYALYVEAIAQAGDARGRARRQAALAEAGQVLDGMSEEARQLADLQELGSLIAAARAASG